MDWNSRVRAAFAGHRLPDDDVVEELAQHAADTYQAAVAAGQPPAAADQAVTRLLATWAADDDGLHPRRRPAPAPAPPPARGRWLTGLLHDTRYGARVLWRQPGYTLTALVTLALGIAATTVVFNVLYAVLLKPLPWPGADRLVRLSESRRGGANRLGPILTNATYRAWRDHPATLDALAAWSGGPATLSNAGPAERVEVASVTAGLFSLMGARVALGSLFTEADEKPGNAPPAVISYGLWQQRFGGASSVLGQTFRLDGKAYRVAGVMNRGFGFPTAETQIWVPCFVPPVFDGTSDMRRLSMMRAIGRLRPGATPAQAAAEGTSRARHGEDPGLVAVAVFGSNGPVEVSAVPLLEAETAEVRPALLILMAAVALLLVTATANVAGLQVARATSRRREVAIRSALGAGTARIARQLLVESLLLGLAACAAALMAAGAMVSGLRRLLPADFPRLADVRLDTPVLLAALAVSVCAALVFGLWPAILTRGVPIAESLAENSLAPVGGGLRSRTARARAIVMALQVACACVLVLGAALLGRSFQALLRVDRGFDPRGVLAATLPLPEPAYTGIRRAQIADALLQRLRSLPSVRAASVCSLVPMTQGGALAAWTMPARHGTGTRSAHARVVDASAGYFEALGLRLVEGRGFTNADTSTARKVVVVSRSFAEQYLERPYVGQQTFDASVVGVVEDVRDRVTADDVQPQAYFPWAQNKNGLTTDEPRLVVRTTGDPRLLVPTLRRLVREQDPALTLDAVQTMEDRVGTGLARPRLYAVLLAAFAGSALVIAAVGLFGVLSYTVALRTREIGVRVALGARPFDVVALVVRQGLAMALAGTALGLGLSLALLKALASLLYGVTVYDAWSYAIALAALVAVATVACAIPAARAARTDPLQAIRH